MVVYETTIFKQDNSDGKFQMLIEEKLQLYLLIKITYYQVEKMQYYEFGPDPLTNYLLNTVTIENLW